LNSLITLSALTLFYVYLTHKSNWKYMIVLIAAVIPIAIFANLMRVLILILLTYYAGEAVAQGFLHNFAGMTTFGIALVSIYLFDQLCQKITGRGAPGPAV
jgi:exosortase/archaeosortase family protein